MKICEYCGKEIASPNARKFCSQQCNINWQNENREREPEHLCPYCQTVIPAKRKYCKECSKQVVYARNHATQVCPKYEDEDRYNDLIDEFLRKKFGLGEKKEKTKIPEKFLVRGTISIRQGWR